MSAKRYNIALLVANITDPFSNAVTRGAVSAAARLDADLTVFPGKYVGIQDKYDLYDTTYEYQHNVLFGYAAQGGFDHIIAAVGTIAYALDNEGKKAFLDRLGDVPVLSLAADIEGYDSLEFDNSSVMYTHIRQIWSITSLAISSYVRPEGYFGGSGRSTKRARPALFRRKRFTDSLISDKAKSSCCCGTPGARCPLPF